MRISDRCRDPIRVYCVAMDTESPSAYITLEAGRQNNFAIIHQKRLQDRFQCDGPTMPQIYQESGNTSFSKVKIDLSTLRIVDDDFQFAQSSGIKRIPYGTAGDCYSMNLGNCRKGKFKIDLTGTLLKVRPEVTWLPQGLPKGIRIQVKQGVRFEV